MEPALCISSCVCTCILIICNWCFLYGNFFHLAPGKCINMELSIKTPYLHENVENEPMKSTGYFGPENKYSSMLWKHLKVRWSAELGKALKSHNPTDRVLLLGDGMLVTPLICWPAWPALLRLVEEVETFALDKGEGGMLCYDLWQHLTYFSFKTSRKRPLGSSPKGPDFLRLCHPGLDKKHRRKRALLLLLSGYLTLFISCFLSPSFQGL